MAEFRAPGVFIEETSAGRPPIMQVATSTTAFVGQFASGNVGEPTVVTSWAEAVLVFGAVGSEASHGVRQFFLNGGSRAVILRVAKRNGRRPTASDYQAALPALDSVDYSLLCLPAMASMTDRDFGRLVSFLNQFCEERSVFFFVDPNVDDTMSAIGGFDMSIGSPNNAVYFPRMEVPDASVKAGARVVAASGAMAGIYARTDTRRGVWKAPAGREARLNGGKVVTALTDTETNTLMQRGINALRHFPSLGSVAWGARTGDGGGGHSSEWRYVPVRRLALLIERSLDRGLQWAVFEPNDEPLWAAIRDAASGFLEGLFQSGAFPAPTTDKAYFVQCGRDTMTSADMASGFVNAIVGFAPLKPAEFVLIRMRIPAATET